MAIVIIRPGRQKLSYTTGSSYRGFNPESPQYEADCGHSTGSCSVTTTTTRGRGEKYETPPIFVVMGLKTSSPPLRPRNLPVKVKVTLEQATKAQKWRRGRLHLKCDGTRAETTFRLSAKRTSPFKSAEALVQSTTGSRGVCISGSNAG